ncbi:MAG TPA: hypothetical protein VMM15_16675 [Bradyrhizobium sp.]|nr:hypothetical protein [Bradyrhizobium sp.]
MHWIDPESLPAVAGTVERFVLNPHGEVDGFVMRCGPEDVLVHTPPHLATELVRHVKAGETVTVRAVRPRGAARRCWLPSRSSAKTATGSTIMVRARTANIQRSSIGP